jgi:tRNA (cmo5U34)-methyltransferase
MKKATVSEIEKRFDNDVERFSNLETGQVSTIDALLTMETITEAAKRIVPAASQLLDIGCGAGNYSLKMLSRLPGLNCTLVDLSQPMLTRAVDRIRPATSGTVTTIKGDIREINLEEQQFDIILAGAVLHHLRGDEEWERCFRKFFLALKPGGCLMIADLVAQEITELNAFTWEKYGDYLESIQGREYREKVLAYVEHEDTPRPLTYQLQLMKTVGFRHTDILHKNLCFASFCGIK